MKRLQLQSNFTSGQLSPRLWAHVDVSKYKDGLQVLQNARVLPQGPIAKRNGSQYIATVKDSTKLVRLLKFQFSQTVSYILEFGHHYIRFYKGGNSRTAAQIMSGGIPYEVTTTYDQTEIASITFAQFADTIYLAHGNHPPAKLVWTSDSSWSLSDVVFFPPITSEEGYAPNVTLTPAATTGTSINFTASGAVFLAADVGRQIIETDSDGKYNGGGRAAISSLTSTTVVVANIVNAFSTSSAIAAGSWKLDLSPYSELTPNGTQLGTTIGIQSLNPNTSGHVQPNTTVSPAAISGSAISFVAGSAHTFDSSMIGRLLVNLIGPGKGTIAGVGGTNNDTASVNITESWPNTSTWAATNWEIQNPIDTFRSADLNTYLYLQNGIVYITSVDSSNHVTGQVQKALDKLTKTQIWSLEVPAWSAGNGYPATVAFNQQRLMLASWSDAPQTVVFSKTGLFTDMGVGANDADALQIDIATNAVNQVNWALNIRQDMVLGTGGAEVSITSSSGPISASTVEQVTRSYYGSQSQTAIPIGYEGLYWQSCGRKVFAIKYNFLVDTYESTDLTFLAEDLTSGFIKEMAFAQQPDRNIYVVMHDGTMAVATYYPDQQVIGWAQYVTNGSYESVQVISVGAVNEVWVLVKRMINGSAVRMVERFDTTDGTKNIDLFSDASLFLSNPISVTAVSNANPAVITATAHGLSNGNTIKIFDATFSDVNGKVTNPLDGKTYTIANVTTNTFTLVDVNSNAVSGVNLGTFNGTSAECFKLVTTISGLTHLIGMTVQVKSDGGLAADKVVDNAGTITLDAASYEVTVGLPYTMTAKTLSQEYNFGLGSQQGQQTRWVRPVLRVYKSTLPAINGNYVPARDSSMLMDSKVPLYTGDIVYGGLEWSKGAQLTITDSNPLPLWISGIFGSIAGGTQ